jgi:hypothetical protein
MIVVPESQRSPIIDVLIFAGWFALLFSLPISMNHAPPVQGDPDTLSGAIIFAYVAAVLFAARRWPTSSYVLQFLADKTPLLWVGGGFSLLSLYLFVVWL